MTQDNKLYVGSLPYSLSEEELRETFSPFGSVKSARIIIDKMTGKSKGFGFVEMDSSESAQKAIASLHGADLRGRSLIVNVAHPEQKRERFGNAPNKRDSWNRSY